MRKAAFRVFRSDGFDDLQVEPTAKAAAEFASSLGPDNLFGVTHILDGHIHMITVWFWESATANR